MGDAIAYALCEQIGRALIVVVVLAALVFGGAGYWLGQKSCRFEASSASDQHDATLRRDQPGAEK